MILRRSIIGISAVLACASAYAATRPYETVGPWLMVTTKTGDYRYPMDGIDAAMNAASECWSEKQRREGIAM